MVTEKSLMTVNYDKLRKENEVKYGTDIGRIGGMLLATTELLRRGDPPLCAKSGHPHALAGTKCFRGC